jgi:AraC-like DNA-binding protein
MSAYRIVEELKGPRSRRRGGSQMFNETSRFELLDPDHGELVTETVQLGRGIEMWRVRSSGHEIELNEPSRITYLLPVRGLLEVVAANKEFTAENGGALLFSPNRRRTRVTANGGDRYEAIVVMMPRTSLLSKMNRQGLAEPNFELALPGNSERGHSLRAYAMFLGTEFARQSSPFTVHPIANQAGTLLEELLIDLATSYERRDAPGARPQSAGARYVLRAEELMAARYDEPITIADIADTLNLSIRSLQIAFNEHRGYSPRDALNYIRLEEVRRRLDRSDNHQSISSIALDCGFTHLGRFSRAYRAFHGELPSETPRNSRLTVKKTTWPMKGR